MGAEEVHYNDIIFVPLTIIVDINKKMICRCDIMFGSSILKKYLMVSKFGSPDPNSLGCCES